MALDVFPRLLLELLPGVEDIEQPVVDDGHGDVEDVVELDGPDIVDVGA